MKSPMKTSYRDDIRLFPSRGAMLAYVLLAAAALALPQVGGDYLLSQITFVCINGIVALGLMLLIGFTGQISLGHAAFFAVGAYTGAILQTNGWSFIPAFVAAGALTGIIGILIGLPALRMRGIYLAMATLAFAFIVEEVIVRWGSVTRGNRGMLVPDPVVFGYKMGSGHGIYYLSLIAFALVALAIVNLVRSRTGRALAAIRDSDVAAECLGINLALYKTAAFAISAAVTGMAGTLYAHKIAYISPEQFSITLSVEFLTMVIIGGLGSLHGAVFGSIFIVMLPQLIVTLKPLLPTKVAELPVLDSATFGVIVILFVMFEPRGLNGYWVRLKAYFSLFPFYPRGMFKRGKIAAADLIKH